MTNHLTTARANVAARYSPLVDTMGREHRSVPAVAIIGGHWDRGALVRDELARLEREVAHGNP
jgi:hypothetical protein